MSNISRKATRNAKKDLQDQITQLAQLTVEATSALGAANDALQLRVKALEDALAAARAKSAGTNGHGIITLQK